VNKFNAKAKPVQPERPRTKGASPQKATGKMYQSFADLAGLADVTVTEAADQSNVFDMPFADRFKGQDGQKVADAGDKAINEEDPSVTANSNWNEASLIEAINRYFADADRAIGEVKYSRIEAGKGRMRNNRFSRCRALARTGMAWGCGREPAPWLGESS
jgi:hypothetical protein